MCGEGADSPKHWLLNIAISTKISYAGPFPCYGLKMENSIGIVKLLTLSMLGNFECFLSSADVFFKINFFKKIFKSVKLQGFP